MVPEAVPALASLRGVGTATRRPRCWSPCRGQNPKRLKSEASFAHLLCGMVASLRPPLSGKTVRHRLNHRGNQYANRALATRSGARADELGGAHPRVRSERRAAEGKKSRREILRCLKRYVAREVYRVLTRPPVVVPPLSPWVP